MSSSLEQALAASRPKIEAALAEAEAELAALRKREAELEQLIARGRAVLGDAAPTVPSSPAGRMTLHEALRAILLENGNEWMTVDELARAVNERRLYSKRDGSPVQPSQIHARASSYRDTFEKDGPRVRLAPST
jgi:hypothetical protein